MNAPTNLRKSSLLGGVLLLLLLTAAPAAYSQGSATANANATAKIILPITLSQVNDLGFGSIAPSGSTGTVTISPAGVRTSSGGVTPVQSSYINARFTVGGQPNAGYNITLPGTVSVSDGTHSMNITGWSSSPSSSGTIGGSGTQTLDVGATLGVAVNQAAGDYTGAFSITAAYQ